MSQHMMDNDDDLARKRADLAYCQRRIKEFEAAALIILSDINNIKRKYHEKEINQK